MLQPTHQDFKEFHRILHSSIDELDNKGSSAEGNLSSQHQCETQMHAFRDYQQRTGLVWGRDVYETHIFTGTYNTGPPQRL